MSLIDARINAMLKAMNGNPSPRFTDHQTVLRTYGREIAAATYGREIAAATEVRKVSKDEAVAALRLADQLRSSIDSAELRLIRRLRTHDMSWSDIAGVLGLSSAQAAQQRDQRLSARAASR